MKWAVTDRFHKYLYGRKFDAYMDNNPLMYILAAAKLDVTGQCWVASLANYDFKLHYKMGRAMLKPMLFCTFSGNVLL